LDENALGEEPLGENSLNIKFDESAHADPVSLGSIDLSDIALSDITEPPLTDSGLDESLDLEDDIFADEDSGIAKVIPEAFEVEAEEEATPFDDDLEGLVEEELSADIDDDEETDIPETAPVLMEETEETATNDSAVSGEEAEIPVAFKSELRDVLSYMDHLLESLPEEKIEEFARSEYFDSYKKLFKDLDLA
jgi:hypothetical protein